MSDTAPELDIYDDDYWRGFEAVLARRRDGLFAAMERLEALSRRLVQEGDAEYERRELASPDKHERLQRRERLRHLVLKAVQSDDVDDWRLVDELAFGPGEA